MKNKICVILIILLLTACSTNGQNCKGFDNYRYNPFQFPYPEYTMKAKVIDITSWKSKYSENRVKINFFGLQAAISNQWFNNIQDNRPHGGFVVYRMNKEKVFLINSEDEKLMGCISPEVRNAEKDYCSAFNSTQEYFDKLYLLTPDDLKKVEYAAKGNSWIVHSKGRWFREVKAIYKYQGKNFVAYRRDYKSSDSSDENLLKSSIEIFHQKIAPNAVGVGIGSTVKNHDDLINEILITLE